MLNPLAIALQDPGDSPVSARIVIRDNHIQVPGMEAMIEGYDPNHGSLTIDATGNSGAPLLR